MFVSLDVVFNKDSAFGHSQLPLLTLKRGAYRQLRIESLLQISNEGYVQSWCYEENGSGRKRYSLFVIIVSYESLLSSFRHTACNRIDRVYLQGHQYHHHH